MTRWSKRSFTARGLTQHPPGRHLDALTPVQRICVTSPGYDNIGEVLTSMKVGFEPFTGNYDCSILFVNCGTRDQLEASAVREFVAAGGCLYASDHTDTLM